MPKAQPAPRAFDPRSAAPTLAYTGGPDGFPALRGVPARDLSDADLARIAYEEAEIRPASPLGVTDSDLAALRDRLVGTGLYTSPKED